MNGLPIINVTGKFNDRHIRRYPELVDIAVRYAKSYDGEFDFMLAAQALAEATGSLATGVARGVLNCMRTDPEQAAAIGTFLADLMDEDRSLGVSDQRVAWPQPKPRRQRTPQPPQRPPMVDTVVKIKLPYGMARTGKVVHKVRDGKCRWHMVSDYPDYPRRPLEVPKPELLVAWVCTPAGWGTTKWPNLLDTIPTGVPLCRSGCWDEEG